MDWLQNLLNTELSEPWTRALAVLGLAILVGFLAKLLLTSVVARATRRTGTEIDDKVVRILASPIFTTSLLVGIYYAVKLLESDPEAPGGHQSQVVLFTLRATQTVALFVWVGTAFAVTRPILQGLAGLADRVTWIQSRTVPLLDNFGRVVLFLLAVYMLLVIWEWDVTPWIASAGVVGLAFGFAAKDSLANLFGGLSIIIDTPYSIGDYIVLESGERGAVTRARPSRMALQAFDLVPVVSPVKTHGGRAPGVARTWAAASTASSRLVIRPGRSSPASSRPLSSRASPALPMASPSSLNRAASACDPSAAGSIAGSGITVQCSSVAMARRCTGSSRNRSNSTARSIGRQ